MTDSLTPGAVGDTPSTSAPPTRAPSTSAARPDAAAVHAMLQHPARRAPDHAAPWLHREVARRMADKLDVIKVEPTTVLQWWGWRGGASELLRARYPKARHWVLEPNPALCLASQRAETPVWWSPRRWTRAAVTVIGDHQPLPAGEARLLWANMMLHWIADPSALFERWQRALGVGGFVMFSCLGPDTLKELRRLYAQMRWAPPTSDFIDMHDLGDMLVHAGFADPVMDMECLTLTYESPRQMLDELRLLGANAHRERFAGLRTPRWRARLEQAIADTMTAPQTPGRQALTFEIVYGHAFKAAPRAKVGGETAVSLSDMRTMLHTPKLRE